MTTKARIWRGPIPGTHELGYVEQPIRQIKVTDELRAYVHGNGMHELYAFTMGECRILLGREPIGVEQVLRWHLSISCADRHPTWDEIKTARYRLLGPTLPVAMFLPPVEHYVNVRTQDHVFQLYEEADPARPWELV
jgi:hypothetical protein